MVHSAYELNDLIPNIELLMYKIFMSPQINKEKRKQSTDLLEGNLFTQKDIDLDNDVYKSLLETIALNPKKKHLKKLIQHML